MKTLSIINNNTLLIMKLVAYGLFISLLLYSCHDHKKEEVTQIVKQWQGKEVVFPQNLTFTQFGRDTLPYQIPESTYKIVLYVDSVGCTSCKLQLHKWKEFINEVDSLTKGAVPFLFFFHPKDRHEVSYLLKRDDITIPVCIDEKDQLNSMNNFPSNQRFQSFLLDKDNKVLLIGNPIHNIRVKEMYLTTIKGNADESKSDLQKTAIEVNQTEFNLGTIEKGVPITITATIKNMGDKPFLIQGTRESCGCTKVIYEKKPILPANSTTVEITYDAQGNGFFSKIIRIYGNIENSPIKIKISGHIA